MKDTTEVKTCGREPGCDLVLDHPAVSRLHARITLDGDGRVQVEDNDSSNGVFLHRHDRWIRARRITLCIGDRVRIGEAEVPPERLTGVFGNRSRARLGARHFPPVFGRASSWRQADLARAGDRLQKPRRNPVTGKIEEDQP